MAILQIKQDVIEGLLSYAAHAHPREAILLLRGKIEKEVIVIEELLVPPFATHGRGFASFQPNMLPIDFSIMGVAHSHPSGNSTPSIGDLNQIYGRLMVLMTSPYMSQADITAYDREGKRISFEVVQ